MSGLASPHPLALPSLPPDYHSGDARSADSQREPQKDCSPIRLTPILWLNRYSGGLTPWNRRRALREQEGQAYPKTGQQTSVSFYSMLGILGLAHEMETLECRAFLAYPSSFVQNIYCTYHLVALKAHHRPNPSYLNHQGYHLQRSRRQRLKSLLNQIHRIRSVRPIVPVRTQECEQKRK